MKICGIIAEYNPFHSGHAYHIRMARQKCSHIVVIMSGNFTQRGEPAIFDKRTRCAAALSHGADLVLELPVTYAVAGADRFAYGAVSILEGLHALDFLSFGCETDDIDALNRVAALLACEPASYQALLKSNLDAGLPFAAARGAALSTLGLPSESRPNAILAIEYLKHLQKCGSNISPLPVLRVGSGYHDTAVSQSYPSAMALRCLLEKGQPLPLEEPASAVQSMPVFLKTAFPYILYRLRTMSTSDIADLDEVCEGLEYKIAKASQSSCDLDEFLMLIKSKRYSMSRIKRILIHGLLGVTSARNEQIDSLPPYARVLGVKKESISLLSLFAKSSEIPVVVRPSELQHPGLDLDILASDVYSLFTGAPARLDYTDRLLVL